MDIQIILKQKKTKELKKSIRKKIINRDKKYICSRIELLGRDPIYRIIDNGIYDLYINQNILYYRGDEYKNIYNIDDRDIKQYNIIKN